MRLGGSRSASVRPGGDEEDRTPDPLLARQVLSQLSYTPECFIRFSCFGRASDFYSSQFPLLKVQFLFLLKK